jgi:hypothetical protein
MIERHIYTSLLSLNADRLGILHAPLKSDAARFGDKWVDQNHQRRSLVGKDIQSGIYKEDAGTISTCYWERLIDFSNSIDSI